MNEISIKNSVSFILPVYNIAKDYISQCINSILTQIGPADEIIIVDDGSKREIAEFLDSFSNELCIVIHKQNEGVSTARNCGIEKAKSRWICFIDPDDYIDGNCLKEVKTVLESEQDIYLFDYFFISNNQKPVLYHFFPQQTISKEELYCSLLDDPKFVSVNVSPIGCGVPWAKIYKKDFLLKNQLFFDSECIRMQDNVFNMYAFSKTDRIEYVQKAFYYYRFDHCNSYLNDYRPKVTAAFMYIASLRNDFFGTNVCSNRIKYLLNKWYVNILKTATNDIINIMNPITHSKRKTELKELPKKFPFLIVYESKNIFSFKERVFLWLVKRGNYRLIRFLKKL